MYLNISNAWFLNYVLYGNAAVVEVKVNAHLRHFTGLILHRRQLLRILFSLGGVVLHRLLALVYSI